MYIKELTLLSKLAEICKGTLTVFDSEPIPEVRVGEAKSFKMVGEEKLSEQELVTHKKMRTAASVAANSLDVGITKIECVSVKGDILPAEFVLTYRFHLANFSDVDVAQVPVTIYFNLKGNSLVKQGSTTVSNIKAGHYQLVEFKFPAVEAGNWVMTLEANQPRAFAETNYKNNALSKNFVYTNQAELVAESISVVDANPKFDADGHQILFYDMKTTFEFTVSNIGSSPANGVLLQVPAAFQDVTGAYPAMLTQGKIDLPAHTRRRAQLNITFTKPSTAQIGVALNSDKAFPEINYDNNETHEVFSIVKYNPETGPEPGENINQKLIFPFKKQYYTVGYKDDAPAYEANFPYGPHYANDLIASADDLNIYASGTGEIVGSAYFQSLGNVLAVKYKNVINNKGEHGEYIGDIILRYCHLDSIEKDSGKVFMGEKITVEGASGKGAQGPGGKKRYHLHLEADTNTSEPLSTPTEGGTTDTTMDPLDVLYRKPNQIVAPDSDPEIGGSPIDSSGKAWYNEDKIKSVPIYG